MNFSEMAKAAGYDPAKATGECSLDTLVEIAESVARSGEPIAVTVRKANAKRRAMIEDFGRAIEQRKLFFHQDTRWLEHEQTR